MLSENDLDVVGAEIFLECKGPLGKLIKHKSFED